MEPVRRMYRQLFFGVFHRDALLHIGLTGRYLPGFSLRVEVARKFGRYKNKKMLLKSVAYLVVTILFPGILWPVLIAPLLIFVFQAGPIIPRVLGGYLAVLLAIIYFVPVVLTMLSINYFARSYVGSLKYE